jgi:lysozyme family protein
MNFYDALAFVLRYEGGYSHHPGDKGGETNYGITKKTAHVHGYRGSMKTIPLEVVRTIYREGCWDKCRCEELPRHPLRLVIFDAAVHAGPSRAIRWAQAAAGAVEDGIIGPRTLAAIHAAPDKDRLALAMIQARLDFLRRLSNWWIFKNGWSARIAALRAEVQS